MSGEVRIVARMPGASLTTGTGIQVSYDARDQAAGLASERAQLHARAEWFLQRLRDRLASDESLAWRPECDVAEPPDDAVIETFDVFALHARHEVQVACRARLSSSQRDALSDWLGGTLKDVANVTPGLSGASQSSGPITVGVEPPVVYFTTESAADRWSAEVSDIADALMDAAQRCMAPFGRDVLYRPGWFAKWRRGPAHRFPTSRASQGLMLRMSVDCHERADPVRRAALERAVDTILDEKLSVTKTRLEAFERETRWLRKPVAWHEARGPAFASAHMQSYASAPLHERSATTARTAFESAVRWADGLIAEKTFAGCELLPWSHVEGQPVYGRRQLGPSVGAEIGVWLKNPGARQVKRARAALDKILAGLHTQVGSD